MVKDVSLEVLRKRVAMAKQTQDKSLERKKLTRELFELQNPRRVSLKKGFISRAKNFGRGSVIVAKGIRSFAVQRKNVQDLREKGRRKEKPAIRAAVRVKQKAFRSVQPKKRKRKSNDFGNLFADFAF